MSWESAIPETVRGIIASARRASLGTLAERDGVFFPFVSLIQPALDDEGYPLLLLSNLSNHAENIKASSRSSLLYDGTLGMQEPLRGPRLTLLGEMRLTERAQNRPRYLEQYPAAELYIDFPDFHFYRMEVREALFVAGFGQVRRLTADALGPGDVGAKRP